MNSQIKILPCLLLLTIASLPGANAETVQNSDEQPFHVSVEVPGEPLSGLARLAGTTEWNPDTYASADEEKRGEPETMVFVRKPAPDGESYDHLLATVYGLGSWSMDVNTTGLEDGIHVFSMRASNGWGATDHFEFQMAVKNGRWFLLESLSLVPDLSKPLQGEYVSANLDATIVTGFDAQGARLRMESGAAGWSRDVEIARTDAENGSYRYHAAGSIVVPTSNMLGQVDVGAVLVLTSGASQFEVPLPAMVLEVADPPNGVPVVTEVPHEKEPYPEPSPLLSFQVASLAIEVQRTPTGVAMVAGAGVLAILVGLAATAERTRYFVSRKPHDGPSQQALLALIGQNPGIRYGRIVRLLGTRRGVAASLRQLAKEGKARSRGLRNVRFSLA